MLDIYKSIFELVLFIFKLNFMFLAFFNLFFFVCQQIQLFISFMEILFLKMKKKIHIQFSRWLTFSTFSPKFQLTVYIYRTLSNIVYLFLVLVSRRFILSKMFDREFCKCLRNNAGQHRSEIILMNQIF